MPKPGLTFSGMSRSLASGPERIAEPQGLEKIS